MALKNTYFTISEAAKELNVSRQTIYRWIDDNKIPTEKVGGVILLKKKAISEYIATRTREKVFQMMDMRLMDTIREKCGYTSADEIEELEGGKDYMAFLVTRKDGTCEEVRFRGMEINIIAMKGEEGLQVTKMELKDVIKAEYEEPKHKKKGRKTSK